MDCDGHGTHVAGLAGGYSYGVATEALLYSVRVLDCDSSGTYADVIDGFNFAATKIANSSRPGIISMSLAGPESQLATDAIEAAVASGVHVIVAAGNDDTDTCTMSPASAPSATTVGATIINDERSSFSNFGSCVNIYAPGSDITSASYNCDSCTTVKSGTSMACPIVSGVAATLLQDNNYDPETLTQLLLSTATVGTITDADPNVFVYARA